MANVSGATRTTTSLYCPPNSPSSRGRRFFGGLVRSVSQKCRRGSDQGKNLRRNPSKTEPGFISSRTNMTTEDETIACTTFSTAKTPSSPVARKITRRHPERTMKPRIISPQKDRNLVTRSEKVPTRATLVEEESATPRLPYFAASCPTCVSSSAPMSAAAAFHSRQQRMNQLEQYCEDEQEDPMILRERIEQEREERQRRLVMEQLKRSQFEDASMSDLTRPLRQKPVTVSPHTSYSSMSLPAADEEDDGVDFFDDSPQPQCGEQKYATKGPVSPPRTQACGQDAAHSIMMEISPGVSVNLRGVQEIREYVCRDDICPCLCFSCELAMFCVSDASLVLCPSCRVVNPFQRQDDVQLNMPLDDAGASRSSHLRGGVALGFTFEDLHRIQSDIIQEHRNSTTEYG